MSPYEEVKAQFREIIAASPTYTYSCPPHMVANAPHGIGCLYVHDTSDGPEPGCLIGIWLHRFKGVTLANLRAREGLPAETMMYRLGIGVGEPIEVMTFLKNLQHYQDRGDPWGDAYCLAVADTEDVPAPDPGDLFPGPGQIEREHSGS